MKTQQMMFVGDDWQHVLALLQKSSAHEHGSDNQNSSSASATGGIAGLCKQTAIEVVNGVRILKYPMSPKYPCDVTAPDLQP